GASIYAYMKPADSLLYLKAPLMGALTGFVGMGLLSIGSMLIFGPNAFSDMWYSFDTYAGIVLFTGFTAFDTQNAIQKYKENNPDHLGCAVELYLNFVNLLIRFMEILMKAKQK